jgi:hypothetical protein
MFPSIILNKIYWYLWRIKQTDLCQEYNQRIAVYEGTYCEFLSLDDIAYNYRTLDINNIYAPIYDIDCKKIAILPKNYVYNLKN